MDVIEIRKFLVVALTSAAGLGALFLPALDPQTGFMADLVQGLAFIAAPILAWAVPNKMRTVAGLAENVMDLAAAAARLRRAAPGMPLTRDDAGFAEAVPPEVADPDQEDAALSVSVESLAVYGRRDP